MKSTGLRRTLVLFVAVLSIVASACGSSSSPQDAPAAAEAARAQQQGGQIESSPRSDGADDSVPVIVPQPSELTTELCGAVAEWAEAAPTLTDQILENMRPGVETDDLQAAARVIEELDPSGDVGGFIAAWTIVMRDRQGFITAVGGPTDLFETDIALYEVSLLEPVEGISSAAIAQRIEAECGVVVPVQVP